MAELFQTTQQNISQHIRNVFEEGELTLEATHKKFLSVRREGKRDVRCALDFYNLDMIISVGYRVKSLIATRFRIWATQQLKKAIGVRPTQLTIKQSALQKFRPSYDLFQNLHEC
jgi:hypothetical protein